MQQDKPRILIISSVSLSVGPAVIAGQYYDALKKKDLEVDLLLKVKEPTRPEILYVLEKEPSLNIYNRIKRKIKNKLGLKDQLQEGFCFFYKKENRPPIPTSKILKKVKKEYDLVLIVFWQSMLSFETILKLYEKLHCQFQFLGVDFSQMSGGCHFVNGCQRYKIGCGCCPAYKSEKIKDFTSWNVKYRKKVYDIVKPIVYGNHYMLDFYRESYLLKNVRCEINPSAIIDTEVFKPLVNKVSFLRHKYGIPEQKKFVIFFACQNLKEERKGMAYLIKSLNCLYETMGSASGEVLIITAGRNSDEICSLIRFDSMGIGYVEMNRLPEIYSISTLFVCSSIDDAGPMMVGQSISCGTPVVGFDMGSVRELVNNKGTGFCAPLKDIEGLAVAIEKILKMPEPEYAKMSEHCRNYALQNCSFTAQAELILNTYYKYNMMK